MEKGGIEPGVLPPISAWCARLAVKNSSWPVRGVVQRRDHGNVGQVGAAAVGVVGDKDVAGPNGRVLGEDLPDRLAHRPEMDRDVRGVDDQVAAGREQGTTEIEPLLDVDAGGRVAQRHAHLLGDAGEVVVEDLQHHGIGFGGFLTRSACGSCEPSTLRIYRSSSKSPPLRTSPCQPGSMTVVEVGSQRMAGPRSTSPGRTASRTKTPVGCGWASNQVSTVRIGAAAQGAAGREGASRQPARATASTRAATISNARPSCTYPYNFLCSAT